MIACQPRTFQSRFPIRFQPNTLLPRPFFTIPALALTILPPAVVQGNELPAEARTVELMKEVVLRVEHYHQSVGSYPSQSEGLAIVPELAHERRLDGWDRAFVYNFPGTHPPVAFDRFSAGADGISDTGGSAPDDINNWDTSEPWIKFYATASESDYRRFALGGVILILAAIIAWQRAKQRRNTIEILPPE